MSEIGMGISIKDVICLDKYISRKIKIRLGKSQKKRRELGTF